MKKLFSFALILGLFASSIGLYSPNNFASAASNLTDIDGHRYQNSINYSFISGIVQGYPDGTFRPDLTINRAEFTKILVEAYSDQDAEIARADCFSDVPEDAWFSPYVCTAKNQGIVQGYPDGTFRPADNINFAEAAKIIFEAIGPDDFNGQVDPEVWYKNYVDYLEIKRAIPTSITEFANQITRAEMTELIYRLAMSYQGEKIIPDSWMIVNKTNGTLTLEELNYQEFTKDWQTFYGINDQDEDVVPTAYSIKYPNNWTYEVFRHNLNGVSFCPFEGDNDFYCGLFDYDDQSDIESAITLYLDFQNMQKEGSSQDRHAIMANISLSARDKNYDKIYNAMMASVEKEIELFELIDGDIYHYEEKRGTYQDGIITMDINDHQISLPGDITKLTFGGFEGSTNFYYDGLSINDRASGPMVIYKDFNPISYSCDGPLAYKSEDDSPMPNYYCKTNNTDYLEQFEFSAMDASLSSGGGGYDIRWHKLYLKKHEDQTFFFFGNLKGESYDPYGYSSNDENYQRISQKSYLDEILKGPENIERIERWDELLENLEITAI
jgi:hypothetical protein